MEGAACGGHSCSRVTHTCTATTLRTLDVCQPCEADTECQSNQRCVMLNFMGTDVEYGCFFDSTMGRCAETDSARRPYVTHTDTLTSIDGVDGIYCLPGTTTCQGLADSRTVSCTMDSDCGAPGLDDGLCPGGAGGGLCSYPCQGGVDCTGTQTCTATSPRHCRL